MGILSIKKIIQSTSPFASSSQNQTPAVPELPDQPAQPVPTVAPSQPHRIPSAPSLTKNVPHDLYRRLLPAGLFLITFVTVMAMLLIYMDTTAMVTQQFRVNMSRDYELPAVAQDDPSLVAYVRQWHLSTDPPHHHAGHRGHHIDMIMADESGLPLDEKALFISKLTNFKSNGTFVEALISGPADLVTYWLEMKKGWRGLRVRADPRDYLSLRPLAAPQAPALHACLSNVPHPKEISYREPWHTRPVGDNSISGGASDVSVHAVMGGEDELFSPRVKCFPLLTLLLAVNATKCDYLILGAGGAELHVLKTLPFDILHIHIIEVIHHSEVDSTALASYLLTFGYRPRMTFDSSTMFVKSPFPPLLKI